MSGREREKERGGGKGEAEEGGEGYSPVSST